MVLPPHIEESRLDIRAILDRFDHSGSLAIGARTRARRWEPARIFLAEVFKENDRQVDSLGLRSSRVGFHPVGDGGSDALFLLDGAGFVERICGRKIPK